MRVALVLLGASRFRGLPKLDNVALGEALEHTKTRIKHALASACGATEVLDLFDHPSLPSVQIHRIVRLSRRGDLDVVIMYYLGHGLPLADQHYALALSCTRREVMAASSLRVSDLGEALLEAGVAKKSTNLLVLDACFAGLAAKELSAGPSIFEGRELEFRGLGLFAASARNKAALVPDGSDTTMFGGALLDVLNGGVSRAPILLSARELCEATWRRIVERHPAEAVRPEVHSIVAYERDPLDLPLVRNNAPIVSAAPAAQELGALELTSDEILLLIWLLNARETGQPVRLEKFVRANDPNATPDESKFHMLLRRIRENGLIRPEVGGKWQTGKAISLTPFGVAIARTVRMSAPASRTLRPGSPVGGRTRARCEIRFDDHIRAHAPVLAGEDIPRVTWHSKLRWALAMVRRQTRTITSDASRSTRKRFPDDNEEKEVRAIVTQFRSAVDNLATKRNGFAASAQFLSLHLKNVRPEWQSQAWRALATWQAITLASSLQRFEGISFHDGHVIERLFTDLPRLHRTGTTFGVGRHPFVSAVSPMAFGWDSSHSNSFVSARLGDVETKYEYVVVPRMEAEFWQERQELPDHLWFTWVLPTWADAQPDKPLSRAARIFAMQGESFGGSHFELSTSREARDKWDVPSIPVPDYYAGLETKCFSVDVSPGHPVWLLR